MLVEKGQRQSTRNTKDDRDAIRGLPIDIFLHIMKFMNTRDAVQTCVLTKSWKDNWKSFTNLRFDSWMSSDDNFSEFVSKVLSSRDNSIPVANLEIILRHFTDLDLKLLNKIMEYAASHNLQHLKFFIFAKHGSQYVFPSSIFSCPTVTSLRLSSSFWGPIWKLPKSLQLPALKRLHLENVWFDRAEPFSSFISLNSLVLIDCSLNLYAKVLYIKNSNLGRVYLSLSNVDAYKIVFSTPNLSFLSINNIHLGHQLYSTCNLSFLEVDVNACVLPCSPFFVSLLQVLANIKKMTLSWRTLCMMRLVLSYYGSVGIQPTCFDRLESLKVKIDPHSKISNEEVHRILNCFLQNSPLTRLDVIKC